MNTRQLISEASGPVSLSASFNQDSTCFSVGLDTGFCVFNTGSCELETARGMSQDRDIASVLTGGDFYAGLGHVEMLGRTNYVALVGGGRQPKYPQNKVNIWDDGKQKIAVTLEFRTSVLRVRMSRKHIVVALQNSVHIFEFASPPKKQFVFETADNLSGLCCLGPKVVAFPGQTPGKVQLVELTTGNISIIPAHDSPLRALHLSNNGEILATASEKGTLIRVFSTYNSAKIAELRRGIDPAVIFSMSFSPDAKLLAVTSDKSTLHIFDLPFANPLNSNENSAESTSSAPGKWALLSKIPFLPRTFSDVYSFASATFDSNDDPSSGSDSTTKKPSLPIPGIPGGRAPKGILGWIDNDTIIVIGAGRDGRWERFLLKVDEVGKRVCVRDGWKRYMGGP